MSARAKPGIRRRREVVFRILSAMLGAGLAFGALEVAGSVGLRKLRAPDLPEELREQVRLVDRNVETVPDPYLGYRVQPGLRRDDLRTNTFGMRHGEIEEVPDDDVLRILFLGGSVTWGYAARTDELTCPGLLETYLRERQGACEALLSKRFEVLNAGVPGYVTWQVALAYGTYLRRLQPRVVITLDGTNDIEASIVTGQPGYPMFYVSLHEAQRLKRRGFLGAVRGWAQHKLSRLKSVRFMREWRPRPLEEYRPAPSEAVAAAYADALQFLSGLSGLDGAVLLPVLQPMCILPGTKPLTPYEQRIVDHHDRIVPGRNEYYRATYEALRAKGEWLAREYGIRVLDATRVFDKESSAAYVDHCHLTPRGHRLLAEAIGAELLGLLCDANTER